MQRGEVWWADLPPPVRRRPVLLISREAAYAVRTQVIVALITRTVHGIEVEVPLNERDGMPYPCVVNLDNLLTIRKELLTERITRLSRAKMALVRNAVIAALGLDET